MPQGESPFRYPGGKASLYKMFVEFIRANGLRMCSYAEPFAGGAGLALRLLFEGHVWQIHLNDLDPAIWSFWHAALNETKALVERVQNTPVTIPEWERQRAIFLAADVARPLDLGFAAFFLNRTNRSGVIKSGGVIGGRAQLGTYLIDCRFNRGELARRIRRIAAYRDRILLTRMDAHGFLDHFEGLGSARPFLYIDPPYYAKGAELYANYYLRKDHAGLAHRVLALRAPWVMTYDDAPAIHKLYSGQPRFHFDIQYSAHTKRRGQELLVLSSSMSMPTSLQDWTTPVLQSDSDLQAQSAA